MSMFDSLTDSLLMALSSVVREYILYAGEVSHCFVGSIVGFEHVLSVIKG